jgi:hypothetical protein
MACCRDSFTFLPGSICMACSVRECYQVKCYLQNILHRSITTQNLIPPTNYIMQCLCRGLYSVADSGLERFGKEATIS